MHLRILGAVVVIVAASVVVFVAMRVLPGDPVTVLAEGSPLTQQQRQALRERYDLDRPLPEQYLIWVKGAVRGDFGISLKSNRPVSQIIGESLPPTILLLLGGFAVSLMIAIPLGILAGVREGTITDQLVVSFTMFLFSVPLFVSCVLAIYLFAFKLRWLPSFGVELGDGPVEVARHMLLPWVTLGVSLVAVQAATLRAGMIDALAQEHVLMARTWGLPWRYIVRRHVLRAALVPVVTLLGLQLSYMIVGSLFVDLIFGLGGMGTVMVNAVKVRDLPVVQATVMIVSFTFTLANLVVDLLAARLDPRYAIR
jgi:peptide/nickel transport system permease protein